MIPEHVLKFSICPLYIIIILLETCYEDITVTSWHSKAVRQWEHDIIPKHLTLITYLHLNSSHCANMLPVIPRTYAECLWLLVCGCVPVTVCGCVYVFECLFVSACLCRSRCVGFYVCVYYYHYSWYTGFRPHRPLKTPQVSPPLFDSVVLFFVDSFESFTRSSFFALCLVLLRYHLD